MPNVALSFDLNIQSKDDCKSECKMRDLTTAFLKIVVAAFFIRKKWWTFKVGHLSRLRVMITTFLLFEIFLIWNGTTIKRHLHRPSVVEMRDIAISYTWLGFLEQDDTNRIIFYLCYTVQGSKLLSPFRTYVFVNEHIKPMFYNLGIK